MFWGGAYSLNPQSCGDPWTLCKWLQEPEFSGYFETTAKTGEIRKHVKMEIQLELSFQNEPFEMFLAVRLEAVALTE